ncbi:MAG: hypothetical protein JSU08_09570 [Acidobacteria bacterium]|nr:hypothetical protein [Acidobacteriota bacterium]
MTSFPAYRIFSEENRTVSRLTSMTVDELSPGSVLVRCAYSSVNYKDALAATGAGKVVRRFPLVGGIDLAGIVEASADPRFTPGQSVLATSYELGVSHDGGFAAVARVPAEWVLPLPHGLTLADAMALGTAGFTAGLAIVDMERNGLTPAAGPVIVTGATGGVGCLAVQSLAAKGYRVTACPGRSRRCWREPRADGMWFEPTQTCGSNKKCISRRRPQSRAQFAQLYSLPPA